MGADTSDRNDEIWALAQTGLPHSAIAERFGISRQRVSRLIGDMTPAAWGFSETQRAQIRAAELARLDKNIKRLEQLADNPPPMHSAVGKIVTDAAGRPVLNEGVRVQALRELRLNSESKRRLVGADLTAAGPGADEARAAAQASLTQLAAAKQADDDEINRLKAELADRNRALAALPQPGDDDVTDAELVD